jgi:hypothetical protein
MMKMNDEEEEERRKKKKQDHICEALIERELEGGGSWAMK